MELNPINSSGISLELSLWDLRGSSNRTERSTRRLSRAPQLRRGDQYLDAIHHGLWCLGP